MKYFYSFIFTCILLASGVGIADASSHWRTGDGSETRTGDGSETRTDEGGETGGVYVKNPIEAKNITELFETIIDIVLIFAIPLIVLFIIYAGFLYVTARGNENTIQKAHMALLYALLGGLLILGAKVLISVVSGTVDIFYE